MLVATVISLIVFLGGAWIINQNHPPAPPPLPTPTPTPTPIPLVEMTIQLTEVTCEHTKNLFGPDKFVIQYAFTAPAVGGNGSTNGTTSPLEMNNGDTKAFSAQEKTIFDANLPPDGVLTGTLKAYRLTDSGAIEPLGSKDLKFDPIGLPAEPLTWTIHGQDPTSIIPNVWDYTVQYLITRENITSNVAPRNGVTLHPTSNTLVGAFREKITSL
ncbi:MAG TPA: hypothetical protein VKT82_23255 [Ktedonobacterales bacterium]|nr:hypothetical protein [Ktedonobacterales bacterium]